MTWRINIDEDIYQDKSGTIPELTADPTSPAAQSAWVLKTTTGPVIGSPLGLLLSLTSATEADIYQLSYRTLENTTVRVSLV